MNKILTSALFVATLALLTSCNEKAKLAQAVTGSWTGQAERVDTPHQKTTTTVTRVFTFTPDSQSATGGTFQVTADFSIEGGTQLEAAGTQPIAVTVNGNATISGRWEAVDDDEIIVSYDSKTLQVNVDPEEIVLEYNIASETATPVQQDIRPEVAAIVKRTITPVMQTNVFSTSKIDDIKIKGSLMSCEMGKKDFTFHRDT